MCPNTPSILRLIAFISCLFLGTGLSTAALVPLNTGTAAQSSNYNGTFVAGLALDAVNNFTHTAGTDSNATWQVLLPASYNFGQIVVHNRTGCCGSRLRDITIQVVNFSGNVASDFTGGTIVYSSALLNPENILSAPATISVNAGGASGNMIRIKRTSDPDNSGNGGTGDANESNVLSINLVIAEELNKISSFTASPATIAPGQPVNLSWSSASTTALSINQGIGSVTPLAAGTFTVDPGPTVTTTYQLSATLAGGGSDSKNVTVTVDPKPIIYSFVSDQLTIAAGYSANLSWNVANADTITINGVEIDGGASTLLVAPLTTTIYTLVATNASGGSTSQLTVTVLNVPDYLPASGRFVEVVKNTTTATQLHIAEIEVYQFGAVPNEADADGTSTNDIVQAGNPSAKYPPTTTTVDHGFATGVYDGDIESNGDVWSTLINQGVEPRYMLDLGATYNIGTIRVFGRGDTCCPDRLQNFTVNVYADDGSGNPGVLVNSAHYPGIAPAGLVAPVELDLSIPDPGIRAFGVNKTFIPQGEAITFSWEVNASSTSVVIDNGVGDMTALTNASGVGSFTLDPGPLTNTVYQMTAVRPNGPTASTLSVEVTDQPLIYSFTADDSLIAPGETVTLSWAVGNADSLSLNGANVTGMTSLAVTPSVTTGYTLIASNANGSISREIRIRIVLPGEPIISEFLASNDKGLLDEDGEASDWIEIHNPGTANVLLDGYFLTDNVTNLSKWRLPNVNLAPGGYLVVFATGNDRSMPEAELHTNFSLSGTGEYLAMVKPDGSTIVSEFGIMFPSQRTDVSYGFDPTTAVDAYFLTPTPGAPNAGSVSGFVSDTAFSVDRGFYEAPIAVAINTATQGAEIRYTLTGEKPTVSTGFVYSGPITISNTTVLRAAAFKPGFVATNVDTHTYIFSSDVISNPNMLTSITQSPVYGPQMVTSLKSIPTISLTFLGDVARTEKEVSMEMINFEGGADAQVDAGMVRFGSYATDFSKRGMRISFRSEYGPGKLTFPVFGGQEYAIPAAERVDGIDLRAGNHDMKDRGAYMSNRFTDDSMIDMGQIAPHGRFVHVYLNGLYWGQYHLRERWNAAMLSEYFGGKKEDYEAINANNVGNEFLTGAVFDGTGQYWQETQNLLNTSTPYSSAKSHIDVANVIDFMLLWLGGDSESEFRAAGSVPLGVPFKFFMKDADGWLRAPSHPASHNGPLNAMSKFFNEGDPEYKVLLADRIHKHFFNDGAMTPAKNIARLQKRVNEVQTSFFSEAARWNFRTPATWQGFQDNLLNNQFNTLTNTMIARFKAAGMYPNLVAPVFSQHGGAVLPGFQLAMTAPAGTIYYTTDGTDPRVPGDPVVVDPPVTLVTASAVKKIYVPANATDGFTDGGGKSWKISGYTDTTWTAGTGGVGFETGMGFESYIGINTVAAMSNRTSCLIRVPFTLAAGTLAGKASAVLGVRYDDGYVAYLNGTEVARRQFTGAPDGNSNATANHDDSSAVVFEPVDITSFMGLIVEGQENILAIHGMNLNTSSSDFLINAELKLSSAPVGGGNGGAISPTAIAYTGAVPISSTVPVRARVRDAGGTWSALNEATFFQDPAVLVISEIMYNPGQPTPAEIAAGFNNSEDFEFLEIFNTGSVPIDLTGLQFDKGITFDFTFAGITTLAGGARVLLVENAAAFEFRYGTGHAVAGQYVGKLKDEGEVLALIDQTGAPLRSFAYDDVAPWPVAANGTGYSLELIDPTSRPDHANPANWRASAITGGSPGGAEVPLQSYAAWAGANSVVGGPNDDDDGDGLSNLLEYILLSSPGTASPESLPVAMIEGGYLTLTYNQNIGVEGLTTTGEVSIDLLNWTPAVTYRTLYHGEGSATTTVRSPSPVSGNLKQFIRARFDITAP